MKNLFLFSVFLLATSAQAGSAGCSGTSSVSWSQSDTYYTLSTNQCTVQFAQSDAGTIDQTNGLLATIPGSAQDGDTFTLQNDTDYSLDVCYASYDDPSWGGDGSTTTYCWPAGLSAQSADAGSGVTVDGVEGITLAGFYISSAVDANGNPLPIDPTYAQHRDQVVLTFNASTNNWDAAYSSWR